MFEVSGEEMNQVRCTCHTGICLRHGHVDKPKLDKAHDKNAVLKIENQILREALKLTAEVVDIADDWGSFPDGFETTKGWKSTMDINKAVAIALSQSETSKLMKRRELELAVIDQVRKYRDAEVTEGRGVALRALLASLAVLDEVKE